MTVTRPVYTELILARQPYTDMRRLTTGIRSEKCVVRPVSSLCESHRIYLQIKLHTYSINRLLLLGYNFVQHVTVLNTVL